MVNSSLCQNVYRSSWFYLYTIFTQCTEQGAHTKSDTAPETACLAKVPPNAALLQDHRDQVGNCMCITCMTVKIYAMYTGNTAYLYRYIQTIAATYGLPSTCNRYSEPPSSGQPHTASFHACVVVHSNLKAACGSTAGDHVDLIMPDPMQQYSMQKGFATGFRPHILLMFPGVIILVCIRSKLLLCHTYLFGLGW